MKDYTSLIIWVLAVGLAFAFAWRKGYLMRISNYTQETREELKKCTWPTRVELKGSTAVVMVAVALLGAYTVGIDLVITLLMRLIA